jgi:RNA polymerase sigma-32 factor
MMSAFPPRKLQDDPASLEDLSREFGVSRERIRQIEVKAFEKVQKAVKKAAQKALAPKPVTARPTA